MQKYRLVDALYADIDMLVVMKTNTMIDSDMMKKLPSTEINKIKKSISTSVNNDYKNYKLIKCNNKIVGSLSIIEYLDGIMIDHLYIDEDYRNNGIGTSIIKEYMMNNNLYLWSYKENMIMTSLLERLFFKMYEVKDNVNVYKYDKLSDLFYEKLSRIRFGYIDKKGNKYTKIDNDFRNNYYLQSINSIEENLCGISFDQVEYVRSLLLTNNIECSSYYLTYHLGDLAPSHSFVLFEDGGKIYWVENAWYKYKGLHSYDNIERALYDIKSKFLNTIDDYVDSKFRLFKYKKVRSRISYPKYIANVTSNSEIRLGGK